MATQYGGGIVGYMQTHGVSASTNHKGLSSHTGLDHTALGMLSSDEVRELRAAVANRTVPADFTNKLQTLAEGDMVMRYIAHHSVLLLEMLHAGCQGEFPWLSPSDFEQILRVLAYVRKEDDAIPDFLPSGYVDDQREIRLALTQLAPLLEAYKSWRLCKEVPARWISLAA